MTDISLSKALLVFYLVIASGFTKDLYSGQLKDFVKENRFAKHIIGFIGMLIIINSLSGLNKSYEVIGYSLAAYLWFILTTKLDLQWNLAIILLLTIGYLYESELLNYESEAEKDKSLDQEDINRIKIKNKRIKQMILVSILVITVIGTILYINKKSTQYGGNFDVAKFFLDGRNMST